MKKKKKLFQECKEKTLFVNKLNEGEIKETDRGCRNLFVRTFLQQNHRGNKAEIPEQTFIFFRRFSPFFFIKQQHLHFYPNTKYHH